MSVQPKHNSNKHAHHDFKKIWVLFKVFIKIDIKFSRQLNPLDVMEHLLLPQVNTPMELQKNLTWICIKQFIGEIIMDGTQKKKCLAQMSIHTTNSFKKYYSIYCTYLLALMVLNSSWIPQIYMCMSLLEYNNKKLNKCTLVRTFMYLVLYSLTKYYIFYDLTLH